MTSAFDDEVTSTSTTTTTSTADAVTVATSAFINGDSRQL